MSTRNLDGFGLGRLLSWNAMIDGYVKNGYQNEAIVIFEQMQVVGVKPNSVAVVSALLLCADVGALQQGKSIHAYIIRSGFELDVSVGNSLIFMYARCGSNGIARQLFDKMSVRDVVSWNAMIAGCAQNGHGNMALTLFQQMHQAEVKSNAITIVSVLPACADLAALQHGKEIHASIIKSGFDSNTPVVTGLVAMYAKCSDPEAALQLFNTLSKRDAVSWNAMIGAYMQNGHVYQALALFHQMQLEDVKPNSRADEAFLISIIFLRKIKGHGDEGFENFDSEIKVGFDSYIMGTVATRLIGTNPRSEEELERSPTVEASSKEISRPALDIEFIDGPDMAVKVNSNVKILAAAKSKDEDESEDDKDDDDEDDDNEDDLGEEEGDEDVSSEDGGGEENTEGNGAEGAGDEDEDDEEDDEDGNDNNGKGGSDEDEEDDDDEEEVVEEEDDHGEGDEEEEDDDGEDEDDKDDEEDEDEESLQPPKKRKK